MTEETNQIQIQLEKYYRKVFPNHQDVHVSNVIALTEGWESIIYAYEVDANSGSGSQPQKLILRIYPGKNASIKSQREFEGMQALYQSGYPVPQVHHLERDHSPFEGRPFMLMEYIEGEMMWPILDAAKPDQAAALITQFCGLFIQLHQLDWQEFVPADKQDDFRNPFSIIDGYLAWIRREMGNFPDLKVFLPVLEWLEERRDQVPCSHPSPVHWDLHPGNVMLKSDSSAVVIDWTQIQVSDPRFDLGWTLLLVGAYAGDDVREMILKEYQRILGAPVEQLAYFEVANCVKRLGSVMISLSAGADTMGMRPEAVESMRRDFPAMRWVYDLMVDRCEIQISEIEELLAS